MGNEIFTTIDLHRGKRLQIQNQSFLDRLLNGKSENFKKTGKFRGNIEVIEKEILEKICELEISEKDRKVLELP